MTVTLRISTPQPNLHQWSWMPHTTEKFVFGNKSAKFIQSAIQWQLYIQNALLSWKKHYEQFCLLCQAIPLSRLRSSLTVRAAHFVFLSFCNLNIWYFVCHLHMFADWTEQTQSFPGSSFKFLKEYGWQLKGHHRCDFFEQCHDKIYPALLVCSTAGFPSVGTTDISGQEISLLGGAGIPTARCLAAPPECLQTQPSVPCGPKSPPAKYCSMVIRKELNTYSIPYNHHLKCTDHLPTHPLAHEMINCLFLSTVVICFFLFSKSLYTINTNSIYFFLINISQICPFLSFPTCRSSP